MPTRSFSYTGGWDTWNVPKDVEWVDVNMVGGGSGDNQAGRVTGRINVANIDALKILLGQTGQLTGGAIQGGLDAVGGGRRGGNGVGPEATFRGGAGGGGGSIIRANTTTGTVKAVAGGAGGDSGDNGPGGQGGLTSGEPGGAGTDGPGAIGNATGGTQTQGGNGGTSSQGAGFGGGDGESTTQGRGGFGGTPGNGQGFGGGGGGGGYRPGGGGCASSHTFAPGGGGGGGSNYVGGLVGYTSNRLGGTGDGALTLSWEDPSVKNQRPNVPAEVQVNDKDKAAAMATKAVGHVTISAKLDDPDAGDKVRLYVQFADNSDFAPSRQPVSSDLVEQTKRAEVRLEGLKPNTLYHARVYARDEHGLLSENYSGVTFWTNRFPTSPTLNEPDDNESFTDLVSIIFSWTANDPDPGDPANGFQLQWAPAGSSDWRTIERKDTSTTTWTADPGFFPPGFVNWRVRTRDNQMAGDQWGDWSLIQSFFVTAAATPPKLVQPANDIAVDVTIPHTFIWKFVPASGSQTRADLRYRVVTDDDSMPWVTLIGAVDPGEPGSDPSWDVPADTFMPDERYEWQVRTYNATGVVSAWSTSETFLSINHPGSQAEVVIPDETVPQGTLGCGEYRVYVCTQGGQTVVGEITPIATLQFTRLRDDISNCIIITNGFGADCCELLGGLRSWMHELVVFRSGVRVWEGPITRIGYSVDNVEIEAKDVMIYLYRRIMRQGYDDSYRVDPGPQPGGSSSGGVAVKNTVVRRARQIIMDALARHDPNVLAYLTAIENANDAGESRIRFDYSKTAWEEVDDLAATAGLDYTTVGRRILLWDTHRAIGRLPELRDGDFSDPPIVTEYGMQLANYSAVTNNNGIWGAVTKTGGGTTDDDTDDLDTLYPKYYGPIEILASAYGENSSKQTSGVLTPEKKARLIDTLEGQAERNLKHRWPTPLVVRVPDNSALSPEVNIGFQQLIPGVWIPLRAEGTCRTVAQWQKLDSVSVDYARGVESVRVVMSPAPIGNVDPDSGAVAGEG